MTVKKTKKKMGRPKVKIDWEEFKKLCHIQCTLSEIADWFECSESTIVRKCKQEQGCTFEGWYKKNSAKGRISLRRSQFKLSQEGNPTMNIWLGKQYLGQRDKTENKTELYGKDGGPIETTTKKIMTTQEIEDEMKKRGVPIPDTGGENI